MIYTPCLYGGLCNNLLQINNCFNLFYLYKIPLSKFKIKWQLERRYNTEYQNKDIIFNSLRRFRYLDKLPSNLISFKFDQCLCSDESNNPIQLDLNYDYNIQVNIYYKYPNILYDLLDIKSIQNNIVKKYNFNTKDTVCIHIRRNDFIQHNLFNKCVKSDKQIIHEVEYELYQNKKVWIATDDIEYVKNVLNGYNVNYFSDLNTLMVEEFLLGSMCEKLISNIGSTFSKMMYIFHTYQKLSKEFEIQNDYIVKI